MLGPDCSYCWRLPTIGWHTQMCIYVEDQLSLSRSLKFVAPQQHGPAIAGPYWKQFRDGGNLWWYYEVLAASCGRHGTSVIHWMHFGRWVLFLSRDSGVLLWESVFPVVCPLSAHALLGDMLPARSPSSVRSWFALGPVRAVPILVRFTEKGVRFKRGSRHGGFGASACNLIATSVWNFWNTDLIFAPWSILSWCLANSRHGFSEEARMPEARIVTPNHGFRKETRGPGCSQKGGPTTRSLAQPTMPIKYPHPEGGCVLGFSGFVLLPPLPNPSFFVPSVFQKCLSFFFWVHFRFPVHPNPLPMGPAPILFALFLHLSSLATNFRRCGTPPATPYPPDATPVPVPDHFAKKADNLARYGGVGDRGHWTLSNRIASLLWQLLF